MDFNSDSSVSSFNGSLDGLPFDVLGVIFSFVLSQNTQNNRNGARATRSQLACVSKNIFSLVCDLAHVGTNLVEDIFQISFELIRTHEPHRLKEIFTKDRHLLPFSHFDVSSFEEYVECVFSAALILDENIQFSTSFYKYLDFLAGTHSITFVLAEGVFAEMNLHLLNRNTAFEILSVLFKEGRSSNLVLDYNDYKHNLLEYLDSLISIPEIIKKEDYDLCINMYKEFFFAWKQELMSIYSGMIGDMFVRQTLADAFYQNINSMTMETVCGFELIDVYPDSLPSDFPVAGITDYFIQVPVPCFKDSNCTEEIFGFRRFNFNQKFNTVAEEDYDYEYEDYGEEMDRDGDDCYDGYEVGRDYDDDDEDFDIDDYYDARETYYAIRC